MRTVCVFCGSSDKVSKHYLDGAAWMGKVIAARNLRLVYGGGSTGLMGKLANAALENRGQVIGVIPAFFNTSKLAHDALTEFEVVENMHQRKARMAELGDCFIALPGGFGTLEEFFEILTWAKIGLHQKPIGLLNINGYYDPLFVLIEHALDQGFIYQEHEELFHHAQDPEKLLDLLLDYQPPKNLEKWVER